MATTRGINPYFEESKKIILEGAIAEFKLAWLFENGLGTQKNYSQALRLYSQAAQSGLIEAKQNYSVLSKKV